MPDLIDILILEKTRADAEVVERVVRESMKNVSFRLASNKLEFLEQLEQSSPDIILADNSLPQLNATDILSILQKRGSKIPFILVTDTVSEQFAAGIIKLGADDYILKDRLTRLPSAILTAIRHCKAENEKEEAIIELKRSKDSHNILLERITDAFIALDANFCYVYANKQAGLLAHREPHSLIGKYIWDEFPDIIGSDTYLDFNRAFNEQKNISGFDYNVALDLWHENHIYPSAEGISVFIRDITARRKAENEILQMNAELRSISTHLENVREEERIRIAREIHDDLGQQLTGLKMELYWLKRKLGHIEAPILEKINGMLTMVDDTVKSVRRIAADLRPSLLDDLGLVAALEWHSREVASRAGLVIDFKASVQDASFNLEMGTNIFRIYQEVLTNVVRHANATHVSSSFEYYRGNLNLVINDNGRGVDTSISCSDKTLGLIGIRERTNVLGGRVNFLSEVGKGTRVQVTIPYIIKK